MRVAEFKQIHTHTEQRVVHHDAEFDDTGNMTADEWDETVEVEVPVMGMVYRDATPEEVDELERQQADLPKQASTPEERITALEAENADIRERLQQADDTAIELYEANMAQEEINSAQDDALIEIYELIGG